MATAAPPAEGKACAAAVPGAAAAVQAAQVCLTSWHGTAWQVLLLGFCCMAEPTAEKKTLRRSGVL